jgi:hypothetical protein
MSEDLTLAQRVSISFAQLTAVASDLNSVSDELGKSIAQIDTALRKLNIGINVWVQLASWDYGESSDFQFWTEYVGYSKINGKWGISLKRVDGNHMRPDDDATESWLFNDAPRALRLQAIEKIPTLLEQLSAQAVIATEKIKAKLADVQAVAAVVTPPILPRKVTAVSGGAK